MTEHRFETHSPVDLLAEIGKGGVEVTRTTRPRRPSAWRAGDADKVAVEQNGDRISVIAPRQGGGFFRQRLVARTSTSSFPPRAASPPRPAAPTSRSSAPPRSGHAAPARATSVSTR